MSARHHPGPWGSVVGPGDRACELSCVGQAPGQGVLRVRDSMARGLRCGRSPRRDWSQAKRADSDHRALSCPAASAPAIGLQGAREASRLILPLLPHLALAATSRSRSREVHGRPSRITGSPRRAPCPSSWSNDFCAEVPDRRENSRPRGGAFWRAAWCKRPRMSCAIAFRGVRASFVQNFDSISRTRPDTR